MDCATVKLGDFPIISTQVLVIFQGYKREAYRKQIYSFWLMFNVDFLLNVQEGVLYIEKSCS